MAHYVILHLTMTILVGLISWKEAGVIESPFVVVFDKLVFHTIL